MSKEMREQMDHFNKFKLTESENLNKSDVRSSENIKEDFDPNYNFGRYILILDSIDYDIKTSLLIIQDEDEDELNKFINSFEKEVTGGSSKIKVIIDTTNMKYYDGDSWKQTSLITWSQYIGDYGF